MLHLLAGISGPPEMFQWQLNQIQNRFLGTKIVADVILVVEEGNINEEAIQDHDTKLQQLLNRCLVAWNARLRSDKLKLRRTVVPYIVHLLPEGFWLYPEDSEPLRKCPAKGYEGIYRDAN